jgi:hypothetical protein
VFNKAITGNNYHFEYLNPGRYTLTAFIDRNRNNRFTFAVDPSYTTVFELPVLHRIDLHLAVADTTSPNISSIISPVNNQVNIIYNKELVRLPQIIIHNDSTGTVLDILHHDFNENRSFLLTAPMDTLTYRIQFVNMTDLNDVEVSRTSSFFSNGRSDTIPPSIIETFPQNGTVINTITPEILVTFDKIMLSRDVSITLREVESNTFIQMRPLNRAGFTIIYQPLQTLREFNSYQLTINTDTKDNTGNNLLEDMLIQFIVSP